MTSTDARRDCNWYLLGQNRGDEGIIWVQGSILVPNDTRMTPFGASIFDTLATPVAENQHEFMLLGAVRVKVPVEVQFGTEIWVF